MRKKALVEQNLSLFEQLESLRGEAVKKDEKIADLQKKIEELSEQAKNDIDVTLPLKKLEEKVISNSKLSGDIEYGSEAIGKIVLESATRGSELTADGNQNNRELINLLLGKTEVAKAEILSVVSEQSELDVKKEKIDAIVKEALDYFGSIMAQLN
ncbi:MAG: hypothetical protein J5659_04910 [Clostridia bacterium]|nr:hypothetical protein [Clostridia bacterium]